MDVETLYILGKVFCVGFIMQDMTEYRLNKCLTIFTKSISIAAIQKQKTLYYVCSDFVLGYTDHGQFVCVQHLVEDEKDYWIDDFGTEYTVTHWMPLPEKPKGV